MKRKEKGCREDFDLDYVVNSWGLKKQNLQNKNDKRYIKTKEELNLILYGSDKLLEFNYVSSNGNTRKTTDYFEGVINNLERRYIETKSGWIREWLDKFMMELPCTTCNGARLNPSVL